VKYFFNIQNLYLPDSDKKTSDFQPKYVIFTIFWQDIQDAQDFSPQSHEHRDKYFYGQFSFVVACRIGYLFTNGRRILNHLLNY